jgi:hypothetical protein
MAVFNHQVARKYTGGDPFILGKDYLVDEAFLINIPSSGSFSDVNAQTAANNSQVFVVFPGGGIPNIVDGANITPTEFAVFDIVQGINNSSLEQITPAEITSITDPTNTSPNIITKSISPLDLRKILDPNTELHTAANPFDAHNLLKTIPETLTAIEKTATVANMPLLHTTGMSALISCVGKLGQGGKAFSFVTEHDSALGIGTWWMDMDALGNWTQWTKVSGQNTTTSFAKAFIAGDFATEQFSVDAVTHGLGLGAGDLAFYKIAVYDSTRKLVIIQTTTDALGKVTIGEEGATVPFDGTILISS